MEYIWREKKKTLFGLPFSFTRYSLTSEKLIVKTGFFTTQEDEIRLYRILDFTVKKTLFGRMFGLGMIELRTADSSSPIFTIKGIRNASDVKEIISKEVERERNEKNITSREFFIANNG